MFVIKSIFEKLIFLGSYKGRGKKELNLADFTIKIFFFFFTWLNGMGKKTALKKKGQKKHPTLYA